MAFVCITRSEGENLRSYHLTLIGCVRFAVIFHTNKGGHMDVSIAIGRMGAGLNMSMWDWS